MKLPQRKQRNNRFLALLGGVLAIQALLCLAVIMTHCISAQPVAIVPPPGAPGNEGCLQKDPAPPGNVKVTEKDGKVLLTWDQPPDGSCVDTYVVDTYDPTLRGTSPIQSSSTDAHQLTVDGLENGRTYRIRVQAYSSTAKNSGAAEILATPNNRCAPIPPGHVIGLRVQPGVGMAQLCWDGVDNDACVDEYRVSAVRTDSAFRAQSDDQPVSHGGCANISRLEDDVQYKFSVLAFSKQFGEGPAAISNAFVGKSSVLKNGWTCKKMQGCRPGLSACAAVGCAGIQRWGACKGPAMYDLDFMRRQVTAWCEKECPCDLSVASTFGPMSWGFASGLLDSAAAFLGLNTANTAGSTAAAAATTAATSTANLLPSIVQGLGTGVTDGVTSGRGVGTGLLANVAGSVIQAAAPVVGEQFAAAAGNAASALVSSVARNTFAGVVNAFSGVTEQTTSG